LDQPSNTHRSYIDALTLHVPIKGIFETASSFVLVLGHPSREAPLDHDDPGREDHDAACIPEAVCRVDPRIQARTNHDVHTLLFGRTTNGAINNFFAFPASSSLYGDSTMNNKSILRILFLVSLLIQPAASSG
jgi:hypothetical protein